MLDKRETVESPSHIGRTVQIGSNYNKRACYKLDKCLSPTIVSRDKKAYGVHCMFDDKKRIQRDARN